MSLPAILPQCRRIAQSQRATALVRRFAPVFEDEPTPSVTARLSTVLIASLSAPKCRSTAADTVISLDFQVKLMQPRTWPSTRIGMAIELRPSSNSWRVLQ